MTAVDAIQLGVFKVGEKPLPLVVPLRLPDGTAIDVSGYSVKFQFKELDGEVQTRDGDVEDGPTGKVKYTWVGGDLSEEGQYTAEFWAGNTDRLLASPNIIFTVQDPVGPAPAI